MGDSGLTGRPILLQRPCSDRRQIGHAPLPTNAQAPAAPDPHEPVAGRCHPLEPWLLCYCLRSSANGNGPVGFVRRAHPEAADMKYSSKKGKFFVHYVPSRILK